MLHRFMALAAGALLFVPIGSSNPGGPLYVGSPSQGLSGTPMTWDFASMPIHYRVDPGPMSKSTSGAVVIDNPAGIARVNSLFGTWTNVSTVLLSVANDGQLLSYGTYAAGQPVAASVNNFNAVFQSCTDGTQSPVIFDPDGRLFSQLGLSSNVIGFSFSCNFDSASGHIKTAGLAMNGVFQDGTSSSNYELTTNQFNQAITHEIGHFPGLDHSQINVEVLDEQPLNCNVDDAAGLPLMFPVLICQDRVTAGFPALATDDAAWISRLYPVTSATSGKTITSSAYGTISGTVYFSDGLTAAQGVNVIARRVDNPRRIASSIVSGYRFTGNPGQTITCQDPSHPTAQTCENLGSSFGSRNPGLIGNFDIPVSPGTYYIYMESVNSNFIGGSSVGPLSPPIPTPARAFVNAVPVTAGATTVVNVTLSGTPPRFDVFENSQ
jgi:hypothetical protein